MLCFGKPIKLERVESDWRGGGRGSGDSNVFYSFMFSSFCMKNTRQILCPTTKCHLLIHGRNSVVALFDKSYLKTFFSRLSIFYTDQHTGLVADTVIQTIWEVGSHMLGSPRKFF